MCSIVRQIWSPIRVRNAAGFMTRANGYSFNGLIVEKRGRDALHVEGGGETSSENVHNKIELRTGDDDIYTFANIPAARILVANSTAANNVLDACLQLGLSPVRNFCSPARRPLTVQQAMRIFQASSSSDVRHLAADCGKRASLTTF
jgi:hypothetical protein